jgi:hypothetical protein
VVRRTRAVVSAPVASLHLEVEAAGYQSHCRWRIRSLRDNA